MPRGDKARGGYGGRRSHHRPRPRLQRNIDPRKRWWHPFRRGNRDRRGIEADIKHLLRLEPNAQSHFRARGGAGDARFARRCPFGAADPIEIRAFGSTRQPAAQGCPYTPGRANPLIRSSRPEPSPQKRRERSAQYRRLFPEVRSLYSGQGKAAGQGRRCRK